LPSQCDGLFLETGGYRYGEFEIKEGFRFEGEFDYSKIINRAEKEGIGIYFGDIPVLNWQIFLQVFLKVFEAGIGVHLGDQLAKEINQVVSKEKELSRRDFLKWLGKGAIAYWNLSFLSKLGAVFMKDEVSESWEKVSAGEDWLHPEFLISLLRNAAVAEKLITIGRKKQRELGRRVKIAAVFGAGHTGLAEFLREGEEVCKNAISLYPQWFLKAMIADGNLDYLSLIIGFRFNPSNNLWTATERFFDEGIYSLVNKELGKYSGLRKEIK
jgi:hypothetical protein